MTGRPIVISALVVLTIQVLFFIASQIAIGTQTPLLSSLLGAGLVLSVSALLFLPALVLVILARPKGRHGRAVFAIGIVVLTAEVVWWLLIYMVDHLP